MGWSAQDLLKTPVGRANLCPDKPDIRFSIGIDPGVDTGFAVWDRVEKYFSTLETVDFWQALGKCLQFDPNETIITVEVPDNKHVWQAIGDKPLRVAVNMGVKIGSAIREGEVLAVGLRRRGYEVIEQHPYGKAG